MSCFWQGCDKEATGSVEGVPLCADHLERGRREAEARESEDPAVRAQEEAFRSRLRAEAAARAEEQEEARRRWQDAERQRRQDTEQRGAGRCVVCARAACIEARQAGMFLCSDCWARRNQPRAAGQRCTNCEAGTLVRRGPIGAGFDRYDCSRCDAVFRVWADANSGPPRGQATMTMVARNRQVDVTVFSHPDVRQVVLDGRAIGQAIAPRLPTLQRRVAPKKAKAVKKAVRLAGPTKRKIELPDD